MLRVFVYFLHVLLVCCHTQIPCARPVHGSRIANSIRSARRAAGWLFSKTRGYASELAMHPGKASEMDPRTRAEHGTNTVTQWAYELTFKGAHSAS